MSKPHIYQLIRFYSVGLLSTYVVARGPAEAKVMYERQSGQQPDEIRREFYCKRSRTSAAHIKRSTRYRDPIPNLEP